jgi:hypothetical protein
MQHYDLIIMHEFPSRPLAFQLLNQHWQRAYPGSEYSIFNKSIAIGTPSVRLEHVKQQTIDMDTDRTKAAKKYSQFPVQYHVSV